MLMNLAQLVQGSAELRNAYGTGHGRSRAQARQRLEPRHARLAVGTATTLGVFLYETHEARASPPGCAEQQRRSLKAAAAHHEEGPGQESSKRRNSSRAD